MALNEARAADDMAASLELKKGAAVGRKGGLFWLWFFWREGLKQLVLVRTFSLRVSFSVLEMNWMSKSHY